MKEHTPWWLLKRPTPRMILRQIEREVRAECTRSLPYNLYPNSMGHHAIRRALGLPDKMRRTK